MNGPAALLSWAAGRKRRAGPVWAENEFSPFFPKEKQTHSSLNLNTRIQIQTEQQTIK